MRRSAAIALVAVVAVGACLLAAGALIGGGKVRTPLSDAAAGTTAAREAAADVDAKPRQGRRIGCQPGGTNAAAPAVSFAAVGDTMLGDSPELPADPGSYLDPIEGPAEGRRRLRQPRGHAHRRVRIAQVGEGARRRRATPSARRPRYARYLAADGFTVMNDANNHSYDFGQEGLEQTVEALHQAGIAQDGLPGEITMVKAGGERVAFLGFAPYVDHRLVARPPGRAGADPQGRHERTDRRRRDPRRRRGDRSPARRRGEETYLGEDRGNPEAFAKMAIRAGADLVLGSGPHVLRAMEIYHDRLIAYSLGNFRGFHNFATEGVLGASAVLHVTLDEDGAFRSGRIASVRLIEAGQPVPDLSGEGAR